MTEYVFSDGQPGAYNANPQGQRFPLEADISRLLYGVGDGTIALQPTSDIAYTPPDNNFSPKFNQLFMRSDDGRFYPVNPGNDGRFYPANTGQVQIPSYDMNPGSPCITQPGCGYDSLAAGNFQQSQIRPEDIVRIILASNGGSYMEGYQQSRWNNPQASMYQPGRVPPSQVQAYNIARLLLDPSSCVDGRGMCPSDYPQMNYQRSNRSCPQQQWTNNQHMFNNPDTYHARFGQNQNQQRFNQNQQRFNPNQQRFNPNQQRFDANYLLQQLLMQQQNPQQFNQNYAQRFNSNPNYPSQFNPNQNYYPENYNQNYPEEYYNPNYPQDYNSGCNQRFNQNQRWNPGCSGGNNGDMSQLMRFAPLVLSMLNRGGGRGFNGGFPGGFPGGFNGGGYNQFNRYQNQGYNNFNGGGFNNFNRGGGSGVGIRLGNFSFRL